MSSHAVRENYCAAWAICGSYAGETNAIPGNQVVLRITMCKLLPNIHEGPNVRRSSLIVSLIVWVQIAVENAATRLSSYKYPYALKPLRTGGLVLEEESRHMRES